MAKKKDIFVLIDGNALVHRAFHALPPLTTKTGELINAAYGFTSILLKVLAELRPRYIAVSFDRAKKTFRDELYAEYKATRVKQPQELYDQFPKIKELVAAFNIPIYELDGYEADDVIGTIAKHPEVDTPDIETLIVTGDMDTLQLVDANTKVFTLKKGISDTITYDADAVRKKYDGVGPEQVVDLKALKGDPSDNIPGVKGIGEKTAITLLNEFQTLENLYKHLDSKKIKAGVREKLERDRDMAFLSKKLATIVTDAPVDFRLADTAVQPYNAQRVFDLFQRFEFKTLLARIPQSSLATSEAPHEQLGSPKFTTVATDAQFEKFLATLRKQKEFAFDTESTSLVARTADIVGISFSWKKNEAYYVVLAEVSGEGLFERVTAHSDRLAQLQPILENPRVKKIGHNMKYDATLLARYGITAAPLHFDTMIASYLLNPGSRAHALDSLAFSELGHRMMTYDELVADGKKQKPITQVPLERLAAYSCDDARVTWLLYEALEPELKKRGLEGVMDDIEMPLVPVLMQMELTGVRLDLPYLATLSDRLTGEIAALEKRIYKLAGSEFNIASPLQLKQVLFEKLQLPTVGLAKTKTGISTAAGELEKLREEHPIIDLITDYRELTKLQSTYVDALPELVDRQTGRVHTSFNQTVTATGRLSSSDPNFQNIPIRTELGREIRKAIIAPAGYRILSADYSQFELRIVAHLAKDKHMTEAFREGQDVHALTAAKINGVPLGEVTKEMRSRAKEVNFGIIYGMGPYGLSERARITRQEAREFIDKYFKVFSSIRDYIEETKEFARTHGYAETLFGRKRYLPDIQSNIPAVRNSAERMAINMPIQGTQADLIKMAMITIARELPAISPQTRMILQVHDELVFEVPEADVERVAAYVKKTMEHVYKLSVPIVVNVESGMTWGELK